MLNVLTHDGPYIYLTSTRFAIPNVLIGPAYQVLTGPGVPKPGLDLSKFDQGPALDDAGNTYVFHRKVEGTVAALPKNFEEKHYYVKGVTDRCNPYEGKVGTSTFQPATIMGPTGGTWRGSCTLNDVPDTDPYWKGSHTDWKHKETVSVSLIAPGHVHLSFESNSSWKSGSYSSAPKYDRLLTQEIDYYIKCSSSGLFSYDYTNTSTQTDLTNGVVTYNNVWKDEGPVNWWTVHCNLTFGPVSNFGLSFNDTCWSAMKSDINDAEVKEQVFPTLCQEAVLSMNYLDCNSLALIKDFVDIRETVEGTIGSFQELTQLKGKSKKEILKSISGADLSQRYGYGLTIQDAYAVGQALERLRTEMETRLSYCYKIRSARTMSVPTSTGLTADLSYHYLGRLSLESSAAQKVISTLYEWDLYPSLGNAWDFVPYSFVVDWVVDFGGLFEDIDANLQMRQYHLLSAIKSRKIQYSGSPDKILLHEVPLMGFVEVSEYCRWIDREFDPMPLSLTCDPSKLLDHLVEGAELIIQRL